QETAWWGFDGKDGYEGQRETYDAAGRAVAVAYLDPGGKPAKHKDGNHGWHSTFDDKGREVERTFVDAEGKPVTLATDRYATWKARYNDDGKMIERRYF